MPVKDVCVYVGCYFVSLSGCEGVAAASEQREREQENKQKRQECKESYGKR